MEILFSSIFHLSKLFDINHHCHQSQVWGHHHQSVLTSSARSWNQQRMKASQVNESVPNDIKKLRGGPVLWDHARTWIQSPFLRDSFGGRNLILHADIWNTNKMTFLFKEHCSREHTLHLAKVLQVGMWFLGMPLGWPQEPPSSSGHYKSFKLLLWLLIHV